MSILNNTRAVKVANDFNEQDKAWSRLISQMTPATSLTLDLTGWTHDNLLGDKGDVDEADRIAFRSSFESKIAEIKALEVKLMDAYAVYDADPAVWQSNLDAFLLKYNIDPAEVDKRFQ